MNELMDFGQALEAMKAGRSISREGWNGKGMYVSLARAEAYSGYGENGTISVRYNAFMRIRNVDGSLTPWVPSTGDCLAEDWSAK